MLRIIKDKRYFVACISYKREKNIKKVLEKFGPVTFIVGKGEKEKYERAGASFVYEGGGLIDSRNLALEIAFDNDAACVQVSDDPGRIFKAEHCPIKGPFRKKNRINFDKVIEVMAKRLAKTKFKLTGIAPTDNELSVYSEYNFNTFIIGDCFLCEPTHLRFDTGLSLKEDYDFTLQHIKEYGGVIRNNDICIAFSHYKNAGGAVEYRTEQRERDTITYLKRKWGSLLKDNPKRPNEILLNV